MVRIQCFHCCGPGSVPGWETEIQQAAQHGQNSFRNKKWKTDSKGTGKLLEGRVCLGCFIPCSILISNMRLMLNELMPERMNEGMVLFKPYSISDRNYSVFLQIGLNLQRPPSNNSPHGWKLKKCRVFICLTIQRTESKPHTNMSPVSPQEVLSIDIIIIMQDAASKSLFAALWTAIQGASPAA